MAHQQLQLLEVAKKDLQSLNRVSHKLALTETGPALQRVLTLLLPRLLQRIGTNHALLQQQQTTPGSQVSNSSMLDATYRQIHAKLIEMMSHIMKRVRNERNCQLPCQSILDLLLLLQQQNESNTDDTSIAIKHRGDPFTINLALTFLTLGVPRMEHVRSVEGLLPGLLILLGEYSMTSTTNRMNDAEETLLPPPSAASTAQANQIAHLLLTGMERIVRDGDAINSSSIPSNNDGSTSATASATTDNQTTHLHQIRQLLDEHSHISQALFDLLLDVLLYTSTAATTTATSSATATSITPPGLSQAGHDRLRSNQAWCRDVLRVPKRLCDFKLALLDLVAPSRRWSVFQSNQNTDNHHNQARTVALLVAASGDSHRDVAGRAQQYLKSYLETSFASTAANGDALWGLSNTLLALCVGESNADSAMQRVSFTETAVKKLTLGRWLEPPKSSSVSDSTQRQLVLSWKRRMVDDETCACLMKFVATHVLDEQLSNRTNDMNGEHDISANILTMGTLSLLAANRYFEAMAGTWSMSLQRAAPYVAASQLLNSLLVRVTSLIDTTAKTQRGRERHDIDASTSVAIEQLLAKGLSMACSAIASASTARPNTSNSAYSNEGSLVMRDFCYGAICALSRSSSFVSQAEGWIFRCGKPAAENSNSIVAMVETATLLFGCAAHEDEKLRPRAVAALDALLGAYCRVYTRTETPEGEHQFSEVVPMDVDIDRPPISNPWGGSSEDTPVTVSDTKRARMSNTDSSNGLEKDNDELTRALVPLLWSASQRNQAKASRVASARWAFDLLKGLDLPSACHLLCFLAGDKDVTAASIAREALGLEKKIGEAYDNESTLHEDVVLPDFGVLASLLFNSSMTTSRPSFFDFSHNGKAATLRFGLICMFSDLYGGEDSAVAAYVGVIASTLSAFRDASIRGGDSMDLLDESTICLAGCLSTSQCARSLTAQEKTSFRLRDMEHLAIEAASSKARRYLAEACGYMYEDATEWTSLEITDDNRFGDWVQKSGIDQAMAICSGNLAGSKTSQFSSGEIHGSAYLGSRCVRAFRMQAVRQSGDAPIVQCWQAADKILTSLAMGLLHADEIVGNAFAQGIAIAFSFDGADAPILDKRLHKGTEWCLVELERAIRKYGNGDHTDPARVCVLAGAAGAALAASTSAAGLTKSTELPDSTVNVGPMRLECVEALFSLLGSLSFRKDPEVGLVAGEALARYADAGSPDSATWSSDSSIWPDEFDGHFSDSLAPHQQVIYIILNRELKVSSPHKRTACAPTLLAIVARAVKMVNEDNSLASRYLVRELLRHLTEIQRTFVILLADPKTKQLARESACIGLAACYGLANAASKRSSPSDMAGRSLSAGLNDGLLRAFGQTTNFGGSALIETRGQEAERRRGENREQENGTSLVEPFGIENEATVGGAAGLSEASLGAYREMSAAALALGRPDVLYTLLMLSVSSSIWFSSGFCDRYSVSAILGKSSLVGTRTNATAMRQALKPHLAKLIPRLLRACHDPNKQTREQLGTLWVGLTGGGAEARAAISTHLLTTVDSLIEDASNKFWRARVGACGALSEVIVGRSWNELGGGDAVTDDDEIMIRVKTSHTLAGVRLLRLWRVAVRALDDVRLAVRESGATLALSIRALTTRLCDPSAWKDSGESEEQTIHNAKAAASTSLRWLVQYGLNQKCAEAAGACVSCLLGVIEVVQPIVLQPVLPELIGSLLMAMSGLEPEALNYLQVRAAGRDSSGDSYDRLERARLQMAQSGPIAGALTKCLEIVPQVDLQAQRDIIPQLDSALRGGAGFATRAATADAVSALCAKCPAAFKFQGSSSGNPTVRLLRALYFASEREHGQSARDKMAHALGNLAVASPGPSVRSLAVRACERYASATGSSDDPAARRAAAAALRALVVRASSHLVDGGPNDIWRRRVLPLALLGRKDSDSKVAALWKDVWDEGGSVCQSNKSESRIQVAGILLEDQLLPFLVDACVDAMNDVSWSRRLTACEALIELCRLGVLSPAPKGVNSSATEGEQYNARRRAEASCLGLNSCVRLMMKPRLWTGKVAVVQAATKIASQWTMACLSDDADSALGWDSTSGDCPWAPIVASLETSTDDLFLRDGWFRSEHDDFLEPSDVATDSDHSVSHTDKSDTATDSTKINFEEGDRILESEAENDDVTMKGSAFTGSLTLSGFCRALLSQGIPGECAKRPAAAVVDDILPYRAAALEGLANILRSIPSTVTSDKGRIAVHEKKILYTRLSPQLWKAIDQGASSRTGDKVIDPPLIVAKAIDCLRDAIWEGIGGTSITEAGPGHLMQLLKILRLAGGPKQAAWTVREASVLATATIASRCHKCVFESHQTVDELVEMARYVLKDKKFWRVRLAGLKMLFALVSRAQPGMKSATTWSTSGPTASPDDTIDRETRTVLESLLPYKEAIALLARASLSDPEPAVTSLASDIVQEMAWWP